MEGHDEQQSAAASSTEHSNSNHSATPAPSSSSPSSSSASSAMTTPAAAPQQGAAGAADAAPTSSSSADQVQVVPVKVGTGVFMPMVGRTYTRNKPQRRRNATTSCLQPTEGASSRQQPRRNISSTSLQGGAMPDQHQHHHHPLGTTQHAMGSGAGPSMLMGPACGGGPAAAQSYMMLQSGSHLSPPTPTAIMLPTANSNNTGSYAVVGVPGQQLQHQQQVLLPQQHSMQQYQQPQQQQQQLSPFAVLVGGTSSSATSPRLPSNSVLDDRLPSLAACLPLSTVDQQGAGVLSAAAVNAATMLPASSSSGINPTLHFSSNGGFLQAEGFTMQSAMCQQDAVLGSSSGSAVAPVRRSCSFTGPDAGLAGHSGSVLTSQDVVLSAPQAVGAGSCGQPLMAQLSSLGLSGLSEQDVLSALTAAGLGGGTGDANLEHQQDQIEQHINRLSIMKQLLQLRQQHKTQQRLLQMQQTQQEQLLQQQLMQAEAANASQAANPTSEEPQKLQQELMQLLNRRSFGDSALSVDPSGAAVPGSTLLHSAPSLAFSTGGVSAGPTSTPLMMTYLHQQQPQQQLQMQEADSLQSADAATLSNLLQERMSLRHQQQQQTAVLGMPANLGPVQHPQQQQQQALHVGSALAPSQGLVLQGWGQL